MDALLAAAATTTCAPAQSPPPSSSSHVTRPLNAPFKPPSFLSPEPVAMTARDHMQRTLSEGARKKKHLSLQKRQRMNDSGNDSTTPLILKRKKKLLLTGDNTPQPSAISSSSSSSSSSTKPIEKVRVKQSGSFKSWYPKDTAKLTTPAMDKPPRKLQSNGTHSEPAATRRLEFAATPSKPDKLQKPETNDLAEAKPKPKAKIDKVKIVAVSESSSSSSSENDDDDDEHSSASSDECEVTFDAMTLGNMRIIREAVPSPLSTASTASSAISTQPVGLEYRFAVASTVSSIAVAPNGKFLVVGFYNGNIYLYPLTQDSLRFRHGVMLDHIPNRGMYTKLMVRVSLPEDGKFIFAGVYRGSTEIRAFEVDSIELPSVERLAQKAAAKAKVKATSPEDSSDSNSEEEDDDESGHGVPTARSISHTYSDAKLKGFSDVKSVVRKPSSNSGSSTTEYHLLCGLGIKNIHLWRFYKSSPQHQWQWECIFDKQSNGISIEMLSFHQSIDNQLISKSEHQNIRIWNLEQDAVTGEMKKKSHIDVKQTVDATAIYGDYAYGGGEAMALIDLRSSSRTELDLPLSVKEQEAKQAHSRLNSMNARTSITASLRGRRSGTRGRGGGNDDGTNGQRLMRMVSQVAGRHAAPFVVGMCTDGSVFMHRPQEETMGLATPLEYVEGYEQFFQDPSLSFQAQFSDLTRVNTSGLMAVLPLPKTEREDWMVVAANAEQLLVRSLDAFLHRNEQKREHGRVKRGLRAALKEMGDNDSSSEDESESDSGNDSDNESNNGDDAEPAVAPPPPPSAPRKESAARELKKEKPPVSKSERMTRTEQDTAKSVKLAKPQQDKKVKELLKSDKSDQATAQATATAATSGVQQPTAVKDMPTAVLAEVSAPKPQLPPTIQVHTSTERQLLADVATTTSIVDENTHPSTNVVTTPVRKVRRVDALLARGIAVPSPVVSISSPSSASSNPNTPERVKSLTESQRQALVVKDFEWTPKPVADDASASATAVPYDAATTASTATSTAETAAGKRGRTVKKKSLKGRSKIVAQALFTGDDDVAAIRADGTTTTASVSADVGSIETTVKRVAETELREEPLLKKLKIASAEAPTEPAATSPSMDDDQACTDVEDEFEEQPQELLFTCTPLQSDGGSLLAAAQYQYSTGITTTAETESLPKGPTFSADEIQLVMRFSDQMQRLQKSYSLDRERIMRFVKTAECDCGSNKKKGSAAAAAAATLPKLNWRKQIAGDAAKKKHMKRRHKKLLLSKLKELHTTYEAKLSDARLLQRLELQALRARLEFQLMAAQFS